MNARGGALLIGFLCCSGILWSGEQEADAYTLGRKHFLAGEYQKAYTQLTFAAGENPNQIGPHFFLGQAALRVADYQTAVEAFERVLELDPNLPRAKLELARAYFKLKKYSQAKEKFKDVLSDNPPEAVQQKIQNFLEVIKKASKRHNVWGSITTGIQFDSNIRVSPANDRIRTIIGDILLDPTSRPERDAVYNNTLALNYKYRFKDSPWAWNASGVNYNAWYDTNDDLDLVYFGLSTGPAFEGDKLRIDTRVLFNYLEQDHVAYLKGLGLSGNLSYVLNQKTALVFGIKHENKKLYQFRDKDASNLFFGGGPVFMWGRNRLSPRLDYERESATSNIESYDRLHASLRYDLKLPYDFGFYTGYKFQRSWYDESNPLFDSKRRDNVHSLSAGIRKTFWQSENKQRSLTADLNHTFTKSYSNQDLYNYKRNVTAFSMSFNF